MICLWESLSHDISWSELAASLGTDIRDFDTLMPLFRIRLYEAVREADLREKPTIDKLSGMPFVPHSLDHPSVGIGKSGVSGHGLFALEDIPKGTVTCRFDGLFIESPKSSCIPDDPESGYMESHSQQVMPGLHIYTHFRLCYFMNHTCSPNVGYREGDLVTLVDVPSGTELCWDYSSADDTEWSCAPCSCGSEHCRGVIKAFRYLPKETQQLYHSLGIVPQWLVDRYGLDHE